MELFSIKSKEINDTTNKGNATLSTLANLSSAFKELINKSGGSRNGDGAFDALSKQFFSTESAEPEPRAGDSSYERGELGKGSRDDFNEPSDDDNNGNDQHAEPTKTYGNDDNQPRDSERRDIIDNNKGDTGTDNTNDRSASREEPAQNSGRDDTSELGDDASSQRQTPSEANNPNQEQDTANNGKQTDLQGSIAANNASLVLSSAAALAETGGNQNVTNENTALAGVAALVQTGGNQAATNENTASTAGSTANRDSSTQGLAANSSNSGKDASGNNGTNQTNVNINTNTNAQSKASASNEALGQGGRSTASEQATQQAADLAQKIGNGPKVSVTVNVAKEAETIVSKPTSTLIAASLKTTDNDATGQSTQQVDGRANQGINSIALSHSTPQAQNGKNVGQGQQANAQQTQLQAGASAGNEAKVATGQVNTAATANIATSTATESATPTATASATDAQQSKENQSAKEARAQRFTPQRQPVADQVSVQISKAIKAGLDRISIQLRPENLGRVDVKMDISRDGGVTVAVIADNKDTMELLQRDAKELLKALEDAGLKAESGDLNFNLRGEQNQNTDNSNAAGSHKDTNGDASKDSNGENTNLAAHEIGDIITETRVDVRA